MKSLTSSSGPIIRLLFTAVCAFCIGCTHYSNLRHARNPDGYVQQSSKKHTQTPVTPSNEFRHWLTLARENNVEAQLQVASRYDHGQGIHSNPEKAREWFHAAALQGDPDAQFYLGLMYATGRGTTRDEPRAVYWLQKAAEQGHIKAQYRLGIAYTMGTALVHDDEQSLFWLKQAADQGYSAAQHLLGLRYARGDGTKKDPEKAARWIYQAGLGFIENGQLDAAKVALLDIEKRIPEHTLVTQLRARLTLKGTAPVEKRPDLDWSGASIGTAWPVATGYVVTNHHVVANSRQINLINTEGEMIPAMIVEHDEEHDLALLSVKDSNRLPLALPLARQRAYSDAQVFTVGFPRIDILGKSPKISAGRVRTINGLHDNPSTYQLDLPIQQGNSGGPLLNTRGEVIGIISSMLGAVDTDGNVHPVPNVSFAIKVRHLQDILSFLPIQDTMIGELPRYTDSVEELAGRVRHSVLMVVANE